MAFVVKTAKTIRNNWKKSVFFTGVGLYGVNWLRIKYNDGLLRKAYCLEAQKYGDATMKINQRPRRVIVFLNPVTQGGKAKKLFDKNIAPVLHLAGLEITLVKTEYEGQAKLYMDAIEETDAIVVAGGDGTLSEVVTGLLRRKDQDKASKIPIGVLPLGDTNSIANKLFLREKESDVRWWLEAAMSIVAEKTKPVDVMHVEGSGEKSVYALAGINWGIFRDTQAKAKKYWYFGPLKQRWAHLWTTLGSWSPAVEAKFQWSSACDGCSRCFVPPPPPVWRWWHIFLPPRVNVPAIDYSKIENSSCGEESSIDLTATEFSCQTANMLPLDQENAGLSIKMLPGDVTRLDFIKEGFARIKGNHYEELKDKTIAAGKFVLEPVIEEGKESWFTIDSEEYEVMPIKVNLMRNKLRMFCGSNTPFVAMDS